LFATVQHPDVILGSSGAYHREAVVCCTRSASISERRV
jgi:hypothetical protein